MTNGTTRAYCERTNLVLFDEGERLTELAQETGRTKSFIVRVLIRAASADVIKILNQTTGELHSGIKKAIEEERRR